MLGKTVMAASIKVKLTDKRTLTSIDSHTLMTFIYRIIVKTAFRGYYTTSINFMIFNFNFVENCM